VPLEDPIRERGSVVKKGERISVLGKDFEAEKLACEKKVAHGKSRGGAVDAMN